MSTTNVINYRLAVTIARITTSVNVTTDKYRPITQEAVAEAMLSTIGDPRAVAATLTIKSTAFRDLSSSIRTRQMTSGSNICDLGVDRPIGRGVIKDARRSVHARGCLGGRCAGGATPSRSRVREGPPSTRRRARVLPSAASGRVGRNVGECQGVSRSLAGERPGLMAVQRRLRLLRSEIEGDFVRLGKHYDLWREEARSTRRLSTRSSPTSPRIPADGWRSDGRWRA